MRFRNENFVFFSRSFVKYIVEGHVITTLLVLYSFCMAAYDDAVQHGSCITRLYTYLYSRAKRLILFFICLVAKWRGSTTFVNGGSPPVTSYGVRIISQRRFFLHRRIRLPIIIKETETAAEFPIFRRKWPQKLMSVWVLRNQTKRQIMAAGREREEWDKADGPAVD